MSTKKEYKAILKNTGKGLTFTKTCKIRWQDINKAKDIEMELMPICKQA